MAAAGCKAAVCVKSSDVAECRLCHEGHLVQRASTIMWFPGAHLFILSRHLHNGRRKEQ